MPYHYRQFFRATVLAFFVLSSSNGKSQNIHNSETSPASIKIMLGLCHEAGALVNEGLEKKRANFQFLAATMYENGECTETNWETAAKYYQHAFQSGIQLALPRMVALYARSNRDPAAALWWGSHRAELLPPACVPTSHPVKATAAFIDELAQWPEDRLRACVYSAGVVFRIWSDVGYIRDSGRGNLEDITVVFKPGAGTIEWIDYRKNLLATSRWQSVRSELDTSSAPEDDDFALELWTIGVRALQQFGQPPSVDQNWIIKKTYRMERPRRASGIPTVISINN